MYRCQLCGAIAPPRTPSYVVVLKTRPPTYPFRPNAFRVVECSGGRRKIVEKDDPGGTGYETVAEVRVCPTCHSHQQPAAPSS